MSHDIESNREKGVRCKFPEKNIEKHGPPGFGCGLVNPSSGWKVGEKETDCGWLRIPAPVENGGLSMFIPLFTGFQPSF